jgi:hypothetical protein
MFNINDLQKGYKMLKLGETYTFTSRRGETKQFKITSVIRGHHGRFGDTLSINTEHEVNWMDNPVSVEVRNRRGEYYVKVDKGAPDKPVTYWLPIE